MKKFSTTIGNLYDIEQSILGSGVMNMAFSRKGGLSVSRNMKKFESELEEYKKQRSELIKQYSGGNDSINPDCEGWDEFIKEYAELSSVEVSVDINTIEDGDLPEKATPFLCSVLDFMIENVASDLKEE